MTNPCTVGELRAMLALFPDETPVLVDGYEAAYIAIQKLMDAAVVERAPEWLDLFAPMMGTHAEESDREAHDSEPFRAVVISRNP